MPSDAPSRTPDPPPADWQPLDAHAEGGRIAGFAGRSFVTGDPAGDRLRVRYECLPGAFAGSSAPAPARLRGEAWFGPRAEGPPGHAHGGSMAAVLDEAMGLAVWLAHRAAVAARIEVDFRAPIPLGATVRLETEPGPTDGRKATSRARLVAADGTVHAEGSGIFVLLDERHRGRFRGGGA